MPAPRASRRTVPLAVLAAGVGLALPLAAAVVLGGQPASAQASLRVQAFPLPGLPGASGPTEAHAINNSGTVAGAATTAGGALHAVTWSKGTVVDLDQGRNITKDVAVGISSLGQVVGTDLSRGSFGARALLWRDGRRIVLPRPTPPLGADLRYGCFALTIDDAGDIGGYCDVDVNSSINSMPVVWRDGATSSPWTYGRVTAVTTAGHLAGRHEPGYDGEFLQAVLDTGGGYTKLRSLGGRQDQAFGVNTADVVVGQSSGRPVVWSAGAVRTLPAPSGTGAAYAINRWGTIAGVEGSTSRPVVWKDRALTPLGPERGSAAAVNDRGDVVGWSTDTSGHMTAIRWHLFDAGV